MPTSPISIQAAIAANSPCPIIVKVRLCKNSGWYLLERVRLDLQKCDCFYVTQRAFMDSSNYCIIHWSFLRSCCLNAECPKELQYIAHYASVALIFCHDTVIKIHKASHAICVHFIATHLEPNFGIQFDIKFFS